MSKVSQVIVLVEDQSQKMLIYRYLIGTGLKAHAVRIELSPSGKGSAENWVRKRFPQEASVYRNRHAQTALIVAIDADTLTVQARLGQLDQALKDSGMPAVLDGEQIARLVPKRNVETWILCLNRQPVDEVSDYKASKSDWTSLIRSAAETLRQWIHSPDCRATALTP